MRTLDDMIENVLAAKEEFDRVIVGDPKMTHFEKLDAWQAFQRRWRADLRVIARSSLRRKRRVAA